MRLKTSPKLECPYKIPELRSPLRPASLPPSGLALHSPQASQIHSLPSPAASRPRGCRSVQSAAKPLCTRAAAQPDPARHRGRFVRSVALDVAARASAENTHICVICPVAVIPPIVKSTCWDNPPIVKTKNSASLQLFCDCELFPVPAKRKRGLHTANYLRFCAAIRDWGARNNCQSQKSCNSDRFLFPDSWNSLDTVIWSGRAFAAPQSALQRGPGIAS